MERVRAVVFDLDGTLIDSAGDIADVLNACLAARAIAPFDEATVTSMIGAGAKVLVERTLVRLGRPGDMRLLAEMHREFEDRYRALGAGRSTIFPGGRELLGLDGDVRRWHADGAAELAAAHDAAEHRVVAAEKAAGGGEVRRAHGLADRGAAHDIAPAGDGRHAIDAEAETLA